MKQKFYDDLDNSRKKALEIKNSSHENYYEISFNQTKKNFFKFYDAIFSL